MRSPRGLGHERLAEGVSPVAKAGTGPGFVTGSGLVTGPGFVTADSLVDAASLVKGPAS